jgi:hypothetical protein
VAVQESSIFEDRLGIIKYLRWIVWPDTSSPQAADDILGGYAVADASL